MKRWISRLPWWGAAAFVVLAIVTLDRDASIARTAFQPYSVYNTSERGLSLAFAYFQESDRAATISRPLERSFLDPASVLFRIAPDSPVPPGLRKPRRGG